MANQTAIKVNTQGEQLSQTSMHMSIIMKVEVSFNSGVSCCLLEVNAV
jgi:hypothetical protein